MALQPLDRPQGSSHVLRFNGAVDSGVILSAYPKANGTFSSDKIAATDLVVARFLLGDVSALPTSLENQERVLPVGSAYDATTPAGAQPAPAVQSGAVASAGNILNGSDDDITARTWCDNTYVTVQPTDAAAALALLAINPSQTRICLDSTGNTKSGLGLATGFPVVCLAFNVGAAQPVSLNLDVLIEVRDSRTR